jgi:hypothetical protein
LHCDTCEIDTLKAEVKGLRDALEEISTHWNMDGIKSIARTALNKEV